MVRDASAPRSLLTMRADGGSAGLRLLRRCAVGRELVRARPALAFLRVGCFELAYELLPNLDTLGVALASEVLNSAARDPLGTPPVPRVAKPGIHCYGFINADIHDQLVE